MRCPPLLLALALLIAPSMATTDAAPPDPLEVGAVSLVAHSDDIVNDRDESLYRATYVDDHGKEVNCYIWLRSVEKVTAKNLGDGEQRTYPAKGPKGQKGPRVTHSWPPLGIPIRGVPFPRTNQPMNTAPLTGAERTASFKPENGADRTARFKPETAAERAQRFNPRGFSGPPRR